jgi:hypothetical protein
VTENKILPPPTRVVQFFKLLSRFFNQSWVYHALGWLLYVFIFVIYQANPNTLLLAIGNEFTKILFVATAVYFNLWYLLPTYLSEKKVVQYLLGLVATAIIITPLEVFALYFKLEGHHELQAQLVNGQFNLYVFNFFILTISSILQISSDWIRHQRVKQELETKTMQQELNFLRTQINPHFLFNTLNNLYALTLKKSDAAPEMVIKLSELMRYMLYECNEKSVPLSKEIAFLRNYLDLERLRLGANADIYLEIKGEVTNQEIAPLLFTSFLENAFKHGLNSSIAGGYVHLNLDVNQYQLHLEIENSKPDYLPISKVGGIGLSNTKRRLELLYPKRHQLILEDTNQKFVVHLTLELGL